MMIRILIGALLMGLSLAAAAIASGEGDGFELTRQTIDGGGVMFSTGGDFELSGTIGQPDAGTMSGGSFDLTGAFWFETPLGDCDDTGWVDLLDYTGFDSCISGPQGGLSASECNCFDTDQDTDVDLLDAAVLQRMFAGG